MISRNLILRFAVLLTLLCSLSLAVTPAKKGKKKSSAARSPAVSKLSKTPATTKSTTTRSRTPARKRRVYSPWTEPTYADSTDGDSIEGEDLAVRRAAVAALGRLNGSVVVVDAGTGRILSMVNQKLALGGGYQPCSTIKVPVAMAALSEGLIDRETKIRLYGRTKMNLTEALAKSNNPYFARLGEQLGYERVAYYAHLFGLGEKAGLDIPGEHPGYFPKEPPKNGGMGMLTSFGEEIALTPLQLAAFMGAIANGGTLYYLQYPKTELEAEHLAPRVKRRLDIDNYIPEVRPGMMGAAQYGTARRIAAITDEAVFGKTGTCSERRTHLGWFGSFSEVGATKLVVAVLLTGGRPSVGPMAAGVAGEVYKRLAETNYYAGIRPLSPVTLIGAQSSQ
ncbi:MAG: penicillin-binding protein [Acidobacteria bacterium]|nr:penicillin-binding protein [Acidobacteriota bacterium]MBI3470728.1 penicillin-binding protein [Candidatus Solibacter usitatus]